MWIEMALAAIVGSISATITTRICCKKLVKSLNDIELAHRDELLKISKKAINKP